MKTLTDRQSQIIEESINIISERGIQGLTIKNLSQKIGISEPAIYRHFKSKREILMTLLEGFRSNSQRTLTAIAAKSVPAVKKLERVYSNNFRIFVNNPAVAAIIFSEEIFRNEPRLAEKILSIMKANQAIIRDILEGGQSDGEVREDISVDQLVLIIMGPLRLLVTQWHLTSFSFDLEKEGHALWNSIKRLIFQK